MRAIEASSEARAVFPMKQKRVRKAGAWQSHDMPLLPGYVFVYTDASLQDFRHILSLPSLAGVAHLLRYNDMDSDGALVGHDLDFADWLWRQDGRVNVLKAVREGERVLIVDGLFKDLNGLVVKMDRRKQTAKVQLDILGGAKYIWLSFDYIQEEKEGAP